MPKVSVIMPVYNGARLIGEAIGSISAQTYQDWELIVVDDGSTDDTASVVTGLNAPLKFHKQQNTGPSAARNLGLQAAEGTYVVFLDADDTLDPRFLELTVHELDRHDRSVAGVCSGWCYTDQYGAELPHTRISRTGFLGIHDFLSANLFPIHAVLVRKEVLLAAGGFDADIWAMEDWDLWLRLTARGWRFYSIAMCMARYRLHSGTNSQQPDRMRTGRLKALEKLFAGGDLPADIQALRPQAIGRALVQSSIELYGVEREDEALSTFCEAVRLWPGLMEGDDILYAIVCARQPVGYKGTKEFLDLVSGESRLLRALQAGLNVVGDPARMRSRRVFSSAYRVLGQLAYSQHNVRLTRRYIYRALQSDIRTLYRTNAVWLLTKSLIGPKWLEALKGLKNAQKIAFHKR